MVKRFLFVVGVVIGLGTLAGCATTQPGQSAADLQLRVNQLQQDVDAKDAEIRDLKLTMKDMAYDLDRTKARRSPAVSTGSYEKNAEVLRVHVRPEVVQQALKSAGYYRGNVDGKLGSGTKAAIMKFQKDHGLKVDGIIGEQTWSALKSSTQ